MILTIEGVDKTGKNTLHKYIEQLANHKYVITDRGILTQLVYAQKFNRKHTYNLDWYINNVIIYLTAENEDLKVRCSITDEKPFDMKGDKSLFELWKLHLQLRGFIVYEYNTSKMTPYEIAIDVIEKVSSLEQSKEWKQMMGEYK